MHPSEPLPGAENSDITVSLEEIGHPKGTLAILAIYMLLFVVGWVAFYFFLFLSRGAGSI